MNQRNMRKISINEDDLMESVRREINSDSLEEVKHIFIEKAGQISVVKHSSS